ncbi:MAG: DUF418 domain-containing protein [Pseudomonadales bacterium]|nr:DUF418 domain-containing protein [Pseudomonadales bacterium]
MQPTTEAERIGSLDELRGFALLGILLLNILGFGLPSAAYSFPGFDLDGTLTADLIAWASVELFAEGAMRGLFSMLFGAGVLLFTQGASGTGGRDAGLHYRRTFWLLAFGLFDGYVLLWNGDILVSYALAGAVLYWMRNLSARTLLVLAGVLLILMSVLHLFIADQMSAGRLASLTIEQTTAGVRVDESLQQQAAVWEDFSTSYFLTSGEVAAELEARRGSYASAFSWNLQANTEMLLFVLPVFLFWDALAFMLIGMALFKLGVLQGGRTDKFYLGLMLAGFSVGLLVNGIEVWRGISSGMELTSIFAQMQWTYHLGRLGMSLGYVGLLLLLWRQARLAQFRRLLAATGRMALSNYLLQSLICLFLFTGAGLALVGELSRAELYPIVFGIWVFQLAFSRWWLGRFRFGLLEWVWRALTYGRLPPLVR